MGFAEDVYRLAAQVAARQVHCKGNEEATKHSLILPFFTMLGYDVYDPAELMPEYRAGFAANKEKIDYAIFHTGKPALFVEAKAVGEVLENHDAQLAKYFNSTPELKLAVITNGVRYKFFTDLKEPNLMDAEPFFEFSLETITPEDVGTLEGFRKDSFNPLELVTQAENLVYLKALKRKFRALFREPSAEFVRYLAKDVYPRMITEKVVDRLTPLVKQAMSTVLVEMVSQGLTQEITKQEEASTVVPAADAPHESKEKLPVIASAEDIEAFNVVCQVIAEDIGPDHHVAHKATTSYLSIQIDKPSRWFARLTVNGPTKSAIIRVPAVQANALLAAEGRAEELPSTPDCCRVRLAAIGDLRELKPVILAAYRGVSASATAH